jgi:uncharacterized protein YbjT (DUF2867 family)
MNIILGASGQIGSMLAAALLKKGQPVRAVVRNNSKAQDLIKGGAEVITADYTDSEALIRAFNGGRTVFLLTPENPQSDNFLTEIRIILDNYLKAVIASGIKKVTGLSSMGAQHKSGTGNLLASYMLEHTFSDVDIKQVYVRPAYYFSNWLAYFDVAKEYGILPTFFPPEMKLPMIAPPDVAGFFSEVMINDDYGKKFYEISGPKEYSSIDIAVILGEFLNKNISVQQIPEDEWENTLTQAGFSQDSANNLILMTKAVIDGKTKHQTAEPIRLSMDFKQYLINTYR